MARHQGAEYVPSAMSREVAATSIGVLAFAGPVDRIGWSQSQLFIDAGGPLERERLQNVERSE
jgi:hypothetical protein